MAISVLFGRRVECRFLSARPLLIALIVITALAASACKTMPKVAYKQITDSKQLDGKEFDKFVLQESVLVVDGKRDDKGNLVTPLQFTVASVPAEHDDYTVAMYRRGSIGVKTNVVISKIDNTEIPKEIGSEVVDTRIDLIKQIGGVLVTMAALSTTEGGNEIELPRRIQISDLLEGGDGKDAVTTGDGINIDIGAVHRDASLLTESLFNKTTSSFYYAACRTATVRMPAVCSSKKDSKGQNSRGDQDEAAAAVCTKGEYVLQPVMISDPRYYQSVGLPLKGKITMHSQCGVSVTTDKDSGVSSNAAIAAELLTQLSAVKDAVDKKNEAEGSK